MTGQPSGTVTFLFTDIEGSTRLLHELGPERYAAELERHRRTLRGAFEPRGGYEVDCEGDAFFVAFSSASDAVESAAEAQRALAEGSISVRMGVHTGEPLLVPPKYVGIDVHRAARVMAAGHGGQVVVSETTRAFLEPSVELHDLGLHRLKDLSEPQRLFQLGVQEFPPLRTLYATNLPVQPTPLIGRERELDELAALLAGHRLVTLTGPGGSGKTRLALQLAAESVEEFEDGAWWVPLQAVRDPELVLPTISKTVGAKDGLLEHVAGKRMLLLLDNMEQLLEAAPVLADLLGRSPNLKQLVTSREPLRVAGEHPYRVEPLAEADAVELFRERAAQAEPLDAVSEICRRLDCLPLAVELAAARTKLLSPADLLSRLDPRLPLLTRGSRDAPERQRTLHATIEWSHELLSPDEQRLFARLAVFAGGFDLDAAEQVCDADLDTLESLVDKNLVRRSDSGRFGMLETIHEYASERLHESNESEALRDGHADYLIERAASSRPAAGDDLGRIAWAHRLGFLHADLVAALRWLESSNPGKELTLLSTLNGYWEYQGRFAEGRKWLEGALGLNPRVVSLEISGVSRTAGLLAKVQGDHEAAIALFERDLAISRQLGDEQRAVGALVNLGAAHSEAGDYSRSRALLEEAGRAADRLGDPALQNDICLNLGYFALVEGDLDRATVWSELAIAAARELGNEYNLALALGNLGLTAVKAGRPRDAFGPLLECLKITVRLGVRDQTSSAAIMALAAAEAALGRTEAACLLLGAVEAVIEEDGQELQKAEREVFERTRSALCEELGPDRFSASWEEGRALTSDQAVALALESEHELASPTTGRGSTGTDA